MEKLLYKGEFITIYLIEGHGFPIFKNVWEENSAEMQEEDFKSEVEVWCKLVEEMHPQANVVDTLKFGYSIPPEVQDWYNNEITPRSFKGGMKKLAFIVPEEIFSQVSIEQLFEDQNQSIFKYFTSEEDGLKWLTGE